MGKGFNGFPGMGGGMNFGKLMQEAKKMQKDLEQKQENISKQEFKSTVGGGMINLKVNGNKDILSLKINKEVVDPDDVESLEELLILAFKDVFKKVDNEVEGSMKGFNIPGL